MSSLVFVLIAPSSADELGSYFYILHPAGIFSNIANKFECRITFEYENSIANAKSVLSILGAGIKSGDEILLICEGKEEEKALKAMIEAVESGLGE